MGFAALDLVDGLDGVDDLGSGLGASGVPSLQGRQHRTDQQSPLGFLLDPEAQVQHQVENAGHESAVAVLVRHQLREVEQEILVVHCRVLAECLVIL